MIIRNLAKKYMVTQEYMSGENVHQYLCYETSEPKNRRYCVVCQEISSVNGDEIRFLMEQLNNESFTDLVDFFTGDGYLYILLNYYGGNSIRQKLSSEKCGISERLEIVRNLLERILILNMPYYFFNSAMSIDFIKVTNSYEIYFTYGCLNISEFDSVGFQDGAKSMADVIEYVFSEEIRLRSMPELFAFIYDLRHGALKSYLDFYERYWNIYQIYFGKSQEDLTPKSFKFKLWDFIKKVGSFLKKLIKPALLLLAVGYLIMSIAGLFAQPGVNENFKTIGTVNVESSDTHEDAEANYVTGSGVE